MKNKLLLLMALCLCVMVVAGQSACRVNLASQTVTVPGSGGGVDVKFDALAGSQITIYLTGASNMEPYGYLSNPDGTGAYTPPIATAQNGSNTSTVTLGEAGTYTLTVYDATNTGGQVEVRVVLQP